MSDLIEKAGAAVPAPDGSPPDRAAQWVAFYDRLIAFETEILVTMEKLRAELSEEEGQVVELTNVAPIRELIDDFQSRRDRWREVAGG